jgi:uncharacterized membrane protein
MVPQTEKPMSDHEITCTEKLAPQVSRTVGLAITGASAGALIGSLTSLTYALAGIAIGAAVNVAIGMQSQRPTKLRCSKPGP